MADGTGGGGGGSPPDLLWTFPANITGDQNPNLYVYTAERALSFIGFSASLVSGPTGTSIQVQWLYNGVTIPGLTLTIAIGSTFQFQAFPVTLAVLDTLQPQVIQVGSIQPGTTMLLKARGS